MLLLKVGTLSLTRAQAEIMYESLHATASQLADTASTLDKTSVEHTRYGVYAGEILRIAQALESARLLLDFEAGAIAQTVEQIRLALG